MSFRVPFVRPHFPQSAAVSRDFDEIVATNWFTNFGPKERLFADGLSAYVGSGTRATTFSSATTALIAAIHVLLGRGDSTKYILIPSFTFAAGAEAIVWAGYKPLLIDIESDSLQPSLADAHRAFQEAPEEVAGILHCNTFGIGNPRIAEWEDLAAARGVPLVIDSAAGFGSRYSNGQKLGAAGSAEIFSFHATKPFAIGEGGAVLTRDSSLDERLKSFQNFGFAPIGGAVQLGLNGKLQEFNAAIGLRQLDAIDEAIDSRRSTLDRYRETLPPEAISFPEGINESSLCFATMLVSSSKLRDHLQSRLVSAGVEARTYYSPALHLQPYFATARRASELKSTEDVCSRVLSVPLHPYMDEEDVDLVISELLSGLQDS